MFGNGNSTFHPGRTLFLCLHIRVPLPLFLLESSLSCNPSHSPTCQKCAPTTNSRHSNPNYHPFRSHVQCPADDCLNVLAIDTRGRIHWLIHSPKQGLVMLPYFKTYASGEGNGTFSLFPTSNNNDRECVDVQEDFQA